MSHWLVCYSYCNFYQQPNNTYTSLNHHHDGFPNSQSPFTSSLTPPSLTHINLSHINFAIQELERSQKACLQAISNLSSDISTLNKYHTPPSTYNNIHPAQQNTSVLHNSFNHQQPFTPPPLTIFTQPYKSQVTSKITLPPYNSIHVPAENHDAKKLVPNLTIHSDLESPVVAEKHVFIAEDFNEEAPSNLVLDFTTTFSSPKTEDLLRDDNVTVKDQGEDNHRLSPSIPPSPCDSDRVEYSTSQSCISVSMGLAPVKINVSLGSRPSPPPYKLTGTTSNGFNPPVKINVPMSLVSAKHRSINSNLPSPENEVVHDVTVADAPLQPPLSIFMLTGDSIQIFDPGGTLTTVVDSIAHHRQIQSLSSVAFNFRSSGIISFISGPRFFSLLWLPWDRGKKNCSEAVLPLQS
jgi:hypothetical protein